MNLTSRPATLVAALLLSACARASGGTAAGEVQPSPGETAASAAETEAHATPASEPETANAASRSESESPPGIALAACDPVERPPLQGGEHLIGDQEPPVPYSSTPPTSGWHSSGAFEIGIQPADDPLTEPEQVSVLEAGGVVVSHGGLPDPERQRLAEHVTDAHAGEVAVTPYDELEPGEIAFTAWGVLQRCEGLDLDALDAFADEFLADQVSEPGHSH